MNATEKSAAIESALKYQMQQACDRIARGILPTMADRQAAAAKVDRMRMENARLYGVQDVTLDAVRESRSGR